MEKLRFKVGDEVVGLIETSWVGVVETEEDDYGTVMVSWYHQPKNPPVFEEAIYLRKLTPLDKLL
jgi:hypothetical protein